jgi:hypothetical protein
MARLGMIEWCLLPLRGKVGTSFATLVRKGSKWPVIRDQSSKGGVYAAREFLRWVQAGVFAMSLLLMPLAMPTAAQVQDNAPVPDVKNIERNYNRGSAGLWGLAGLLGLAGLAGRHWAPAPEPSSRARQTHDPVV